MAPPKLERGPHSRVVRVFADYGVKGGIGGPNEAIWISAEYGLLCHADMIR